MAPRRNQKKTRNSQQFSIKPIQNIGCYYKQPINVSFNKPGQGSSKNKKNICFEGPVFNHDGKFATPSFILASEKLSYQEKINNESQESFINFAKVSDQKSVMLVPKPNSRSMYCSVCKERYIDYRNHIETETHKKKIRVNRYHQYTLEFETQYNPGFKKPSRKSNKKIEETNNSYPEIIIIDHGQRINQFPIQSVPRKLMKLERESEKEVQRQKILFPIHPLIPFLRHQIYQSSILHQPMSSGFAPNYQNFISNNMLLSHFLNIEQMKTLQWINFYLNYNLPIYSVLNNNCQENEEQNLSK